MDVFDKIIAGEIPAHIVYEDENVLAFLDTGQITKGHTLLIPKKNVENIFEYDQDLAEKVLGKLPQIARAVKASDSTITGINIISNNGPDANQEVLHSHWHIIPRRPNDGLRVTNEDHREEYTSDQLEEIANQIKKNL
jgi:histidine triad (HIT) family protein